MAPFATHKFHINFQLIKNLFALKLNKLRMDTEVDLEIFFAYIEVIRIKHKN